MSYYKERLVANRHSDGISSLFRAGLPGTRKSAVQADLPLALAELHRQVLRASWSPAVRSGDRPHRHSEPGGRWGPGRVRAAAGRIARPPTGRPIPSAVVGSRGRAAGQRLLPRGIPGPQVVLQDLSRSVPGKLGQPHQFRGDLVSS